LTFFTPILFLFHHFYKFSVSLFPSFIAILSLSLTHTHTHTHTHTRTFSLLFLLYLFNISFIPAAIRKKNIRQEFPLKT
jgi:hypothetical protein